MAALPQIGRGVQAVFGRKRDVQHDLLRQGVKRQRKPSIRQHGLKALFIKRKERIRRERMRRRERLRNEAGDPRLRRRQRRNNRLASVNCAGHRFFQQRQRCAKQGNVIERRIINWEQHLFRLNLINGVRAAALRDANADFPGKTVEHVGNLFGCFGKPIHSAQDENRRDAAGIRALMQADQRVRADDAHRIDVEIMQRFRQRRKQFLPNRRLSQLLIRRALQQMRQPLPQRGDAQNRDRHFRQQRG